MPDMNTAGLVLMGAVGFKMIDLGTNYFFRMLTKDGYVTKKECSNCSSGDKEVIAKLSGEISTIKGILLVLAVKNEIPPEQLAALTK